MFSHNFVEQFMTYISFYYQKNPANNEKGEMEKSSSNINGGLACFNKQNKTGYEVLQDTTHNKY
jgi:hypothetical protein